MAKKSVLPLLNNDIDAAPEVLASAILEIEQAAKKLLGGRLTKHALLVLLKDSSGVPMRTIDKVLEHTASLSRYVKK